MNKILAILLMVTLTSCCSTDRFALVDKSTKQEIGPFAFRNGATIRIGDNTYIVKALPNRNQVLEQKLKNTIVPEIDFRDADIADVLSEFREWLTSKDEDERWVDPPVEIVLIIQDDKISSIPKVTLDMRYASIYEVLKTVAELTGLKLELVNGRVCLKYKK